MGVEMPPLYGAKSGQKFNPKTVFSQCQLLLLSVSSSKQPQILTKIMYISFVQCCSLAGVK